VSEETSIKNFEKNLQTLEDIVDELEAGELSLDDALKRFEKGVKITRECQQALSAAEQRVNILLEENGELQLKPLEVDADT
jgi:exodeoxyribonuclease VII small subunit